VNRSTDEHRTPPAERERPSWRDRPWGRAVAGWDAALRDGRCPLPCCTVWRAIRVRVWARPVGLRAVYAEATPGVLRLVAGGQGSWPQLWRVALEAQAAGAGPAGALHAREFPPGRGVPGEIDRAAELLAAANRAGAWPDGRDAPRRRRRFGAGAP
jgi:hypothetical protein